MEQVFFKIHVRSVNIITRAVPSSVRKLLEWSVLFGALLFGSALVALHGAHVSPRDGGCLRHLAPDFAGPKPPPYQVLHISVLPPASNELLDSLQLIKSTWHGISPSANSTPSIKVAAPPVAISQPAAWSSFLPKSWRSCSSANSDECNDPLSATQHQGVSSNSPTLASYSFSLDKGWLLLDPSVLSAHDVKQHHVFVRGDDEACMGQHPLTRGVLANVLGYDRAVSNWLVALTGARGFLRVDGGADDDGGSSGSSDDNNGSSTAATAAGNAGEIVDLSLAADFVAASGVASLGGGRGGGGGGGSEGAGGSGQQHDSIRRNDLGKFVGFKLGVVFTTLCLFFATTTLVSFTLRETQERMLKFTFLLQHHVRHNLPYVALCASHLVDSLVYLPICLGMLFFLIEFYGDQLLAFLVLTMVWIAEIYSVVAMRTASSIRFFPRFFFLYFALFNVYFFSFPFGFSYLALLVSYCLLCHTMLHFWNRFEVPALRDSTISSLHPRGAPVFGLARGGVASVSVRNAQVLRSNSGGGGGGGGGSGGGGGRSSGPRRPPPPPTQQPESSSRGPSGIGPSDQRAPGGDAAPPPVVQTEEASERVNSAGQGPSQELSTNRPNAQPTSSTT